MARKSSIEKLPSDVRSHIEKRMRENRLTLDELIDDLRSHFPADEKPSRSSLGRYKQNFDQLTARMREQDAMARMLVEELGENPDEKAGALLVQSITTLATQAAFTAQEGEDIDVKDIGRLARAAKDIMHTRKMTREERHQIRKDAQEELLKEQKEKLAAMPSKGGVTEETKQAIREALGIS